MLEAVYTEYRKECEGKEIVVGDGNVNAELLLIGEAPGKDEVRLGKPFVGMAGKNLSEFLEILGLSRDSIYITNVIKYRLSKLNEKSGRVVNRPALPQEIRQNQNYLKKELTIIKPQYIVTLGNVPLRAVTDKMDYTIGEMHGKTHKIMIQDHEYNLFALYHPASVIYNRSLKDTYIEDIQKLKSIISK